MLAPQAARGRQPPRREQGARTRGPNMRPPTKKGGSGGATGAKGAETAESRAGAFFAPAGRCSRGDRLLLGRKHRFDACLGRPATLSF